MFTLFAPLITWVEIKTLSGSESCYELGPETWHLVLAMFLCFWRNKMMLIWIYWWILKYWFLVTFPHNSLKVHFTKMKCCALIYSFILTTPYTYSDKLKHFNKKKKSVQYWEQQSFSKRDLITCLTAEVYEGKLSPGMNQLNVGHFYEYLMLCFNKFDNF